MSESIYFLDDKQALIKVVHEDKIIECIQTKELTSDKSELMNDTLSVSVFDDDKIRDASFMAVREEDKSFSMYKIITDSDPRGRLSFVGVSFAVDELSAFVVSDIRPKNKSMKAVAEQILEATNSEWRVGHVDATLPAISGSFYYISVKEALIQLQTFGCEILFKCTITGNKVTDKWIEIYKQIGVVSNKRFVYGSNALEVVRQRDRSQLYTSIIGRGKGEEVGNGYGRRIEFTDVEWKKSSGNPLDKPKGQNWIEYPEMTALYGMPTKSGAKRKRETVLIFEDIEDPKELLQATYENLVEYSRPLIQFKTNVLGADSIGNIVQIHRSDKGYHYKTRVFSVKLDRVTGKTEAGLGDNLNMSSTRQAAIVQNNISNLTESKMTFYESTEIGKYQDDIMRGAGDNGGSIYWVNGIEAGVSDSREIYETVYMDGPNIPRSRFFMVQNNSGISFKQCKKGEWQTIQDVHNGDSTTAWTLDGTFNANFIKAGILSGILVQGVALKTLDDKDFQLVAEGGQLSFEKKVISTGLDDVHGESLGSIVATYGGGKINGFAVWKEPNYIFSINAGDGGDRGNPVFQIPADVTADKRKYNLYGDGKFSKGNITMDGRLDVKELYVDGRLDVKELYVNGVKIDTNGGGNTGGNDNGWNGQYPPEVTTDRDKRYWQIWTMAIGAGFTKQAAAALLGNAQGESDANPTADEGNGAPGFGYGVWQWTDSTGATSGRVYMINLMTKAGISDDPDTIAAQFKLLMWHAPNGQWIATSAYPYTWIQFMNLTDINTAAQAFVANFERPRDPHPERTTWAQEWYDKFKDLEIPASKGYIKPIADPIRVTSEFGWRTSPITGAQEFHNGIDLVNGNPNTPIFASADGEVIVAGDANYFDWYGNWTVIKHADGMYTGYAHQSRVDVSKGQKVTAGQQIGLMGTTGPSTGEHLHFQFMDEFYPSSAAHFHNARDYIDF
ncbi:phage tail spike protein [Enterococcus lactis]|uniref:phage tail spike protein n=2 Tax=Enterococcus TaxID=1350 RepID=UPI00288DB7EA|nr:phage tail spike protein [Enterococcus lactis]MDT2780160.1 phage tail spike protein [Enterococcus lactis]